MKQEPLIHLALKPGNVVRFQRNDKGRWHEATVAGVEDDGSVRIIDAKMASRSIMAERLEVQVRTKRGGHAWEPVLARAAEPEQLGLL